ncbi:Hypothetical predicted protein [Podarcis lilfordi]|uniref:Uncharacterized protein n=1 Tax=Podarcis lilfordi TaxID=74358 RepID=A0AA35LAQ2_9SAUR|nr:Hypothetical predicted protein [Podarcis lilfordi]
MLPHGNDQIWDSQRSGALQMWLDSLHKSQELRMEGFGVFNDILRLPYWLPYLHQGFFIHLANLPFPPGGDVESKGSVWSSSNQDSGVFSPGGVGDIGGQTLPKCLFEEAVLKGGVSRSISHPSYAPSSKSADVAASSSIDPFSLLVDFTLVAWCSSESRQVRLGGVSCQHLA